MEIVITKYEKVDIDPRKVVEQLYELELNDGYLDKSDGKYFIVISNNLYLEINKEDYKYIKALETVLNRLK